MKLLLVIYLLSPFVFQEDSNLSGITQAIGNGNTEALSQYFDQSVEIAVLDDEDVYSKDQAVEIVKTFFASNQPKSFVKAHEGTSRGNDSQYCIGNLETSTQTFRVYIYMKVTGSKYLVQELRFDKE